MEEIQCSINKEVSIKGIGLHTGKITNLTFKRAPEDSGVVFVRKDLRGEPRIPAKIDYANHKDRSTSLEKDGVNIYIIEHVMAAIAGIGLDNLLIEIDNCEPPVLDGSAMSWTEILLKTEKIFYGKKKETFTPPCPYIVSNPENDSYLVLLPSNSRNVTYTFEFPESLMECKKGNFIGNNCSLSFEDGETFAKQIAPARTFCMLEEVEALKEKGLIKGGSLENAVVIDKDKVLNDGLRFPNEIARHKALDVIGDLYLSGKHLKNTHIIGVKSGHDLNIKMVKKIIKGGEDMGEVMDLKEIKKILPHRYPFLFVDKILSLGKKRAVGIKSVTGNEEFFQGHFPDFPVMPAVLTLETMAQVAGVLLLSKSKSGDKLPFFAVIENAKFRKPVLPGDQLLIEVEILKLKERTGKVHSSATVADKVVAEADFIFSLVDKT
ncbi:MAG: UDP-3-O-acyl-N-acetylglucosamine deacetylase [Candidatus Ratteibacteria bacterium]|nr:UDP-3-O-acyl-N-acetylglucosamine deacetylase [Candidatus Ratteibacteria bacterium]